MEKGISRRSFLKGGVAAAVGKYVKLAKKEEKAA